MLVDGSGEGLSQLFGRDLWQKQVVTPEPSSVGPQGPIAMVIGARVALRPASSMLGQLPVCHPVLVRGSVMDMKVDTGRVIQMHCDDFFIYRLALVDAAVFRRQVVKRGVAGSPSNT